MYYYVFLNILALGTGISVGYISTSYLYFGWPKEEEAEVK